MDGFNEKSHGFIAAKYYEHLLEKFGERGRQAFIHGTQYYAGQRGRRMAQRAIRDGKELTYETYCQYSEWVNTEEIKAEGVANKSEVISKGPDFISNIGPCPWRAQFVQMDSNEAGLEYCTHLDNSICRGFNPYITYEVDLENLESDNYCTHTLREVDIENMDLVKRPENFIGFDYHCSHLYWSFREVVGAIFGFEGDELGAMVLKDFAKEYGEEAKETIFGYRDTNFNVTY